MIRRVTHIFGEAVAFLDRSRRIGWTDLALVAGLGGTIFGVVRLAREWTGALRPAVQIDLSLAALPGYALLSLSRGLAAYALSLLFTLVYGYWAARDRVAERVLIPALDVLQSIPVLGFMPGLVLALAAESVVKLVVFLAAGAFVVYRLFDGPADVFAAACLLVELSAGRHPFARLDARQARAQGLDRELTRPSRLPAACWPLLRAALAFDPARRPAAAELLASLCAPKSGRLRRWLRLALG